MKHMLRHLICLCLLASIFLLSLISCGDVRTPDEGNGDDSGVVPSSIVINEICADNKGSFVTGSEKHDWIELYNTSKEEQDISGWSLSDDLEDPTAFTFPRGTVIEGHGFLLVLAVSKEVAKTWSREELAAPFKLTEDGETLIITDTNRVLREQVEYPAINSKDTEITYARTADGSSMWGEAKPTPGKTNKDSTRVLSSDVMQFSHESGFYKDAFTLQITVPEDYTVFYTVNCADPRISGAKTLDGSGKINIYDKSPEYDTFSKINVTGDGNYMYVPNTPVDKCFVLRAYVKSPNGLRSRTITKTYFIGYDEKDGYTNIPIVTLTSDPKDLYDPKTGLFVSSTWTTDTNRQEIVADMTYIDENGNFVFDQKVGIRIRGTSTRGKHQKNLNIFARSSYDGNSCLKDPLFDDVKETKSFVMRFDDMDRLNIGQGFIQDMVSHREISTQDYYPAVLFLDGEYYGIYNLYERFSEDYVEQHYGVDKDDVWIVKKGASDNMREANCTAADSDYKKLIYFISNYRQYNDLSNPATYKKLTDWVDIQSLCDLLAVQLYIGNEDFSLSQNITAWRSAKIDPSNPYADGRWRFVIYDLDFTLNCEAKDFVYDETYDPFTQDQPWAGGGFMSWAYNFKEDYPLTKNLLKNATFKQQFADTFIEVATVDFAPERVKAEMERCFQRLLPNMENYVARYHSWFRDGAEGLEKRFRETVAPDITYIENRATYVIPYMKSALGIK